MTKQYGPRTQEECIDICNRLSIRAGIRRELRIKRNQPDPDRIADLCDEAADTIKYLMSRIEELELEVKDAHGGI